MSNVEETARMSTGGKRASQQLPDNAYGKQIKEEAGSRPVVIVETSDNKEEKFDPNMEFKTETQTFKKEEGTIENLSAAQERASLVKNLISRNEKLEAEVLAKDARLEKLRQEMVDMKNTVEAERKSFDVRLDAIIQRLSQESRVLIDEKISLRLNLERQEQENRLLQLRLSQRENQLKSQMNQNQGQQIIRQQTLKNIVQQNPLSGGGHIIVVRPASPSNLRPPAPEPQQTSQQVAVQSPGGQTTSNSATAVRQNCYVKIENQTVAYTLQTQPDGTLRFLPHPRFRLGLLAQHSQTVLQQNQQQVEEKIAVKK